MRTSPKVLHIVPSLDQGGAERVVVELANGASQFGYEASILVGRCAKNDWMKLQLSGDVQLIEICSARTPTWLMYLQSAWYLMKKREAIAGYDIVHAHLTFGTLMSSLASALTRSNQRVVETVHLIGMKVPRSRLWLSAHFAKRRQGVVLVARDAFWRRQVTKARGLVRFIANGVEVRPYEDTNKSRQCQTTEPWKIGSIGQLRHDRRPEWYLPLISDLSNSLNINFTYIGDGPLRQTLEENTRQRELDHVVTFLGMVSDPRQFHKDLDLAVTVNVGENTGLGALECIASGCPVVAFQLDPTYRGEGDWIPSYHPGDPSMVEFIKAHLMDGGMREELAKRQHRVLETRYGKDRFLEEYFALYDELLNNRHSGTCDHPE